SSDHLDMIGRRNQVVLALMAATLGLATLTGCGRVWNNPYPDAGVASPYLYGAFTESPNHLDPARSYAANETVFTGQIYEPPLQYHYLLRPYTLVPLTTTGMPERTPVDAQGEPLPMDAPDEAVAAVRWTIHIQPGIQYQPHPAFAVGPDGKPLYYPLQHGDMAGIRSPMDFKQLGTRELVAADYVYEIKRLADPSVNSPIFSLMRAHIKGFAEFADKVKAARKRLHEQQGPDAFLDLGTIRMAGLKVVDRHSYTITLKDRYPQFRFWLAMPFFAPMPVEALRFYDQPGLRARDITIDTFPVGTGPYMLTVNDPNRRMVLKANPSFRGEPYPKKGESGDRKQGLLADAGKPMPFIPKAIYSLERESIPHWNKFMQGYYDTSGVSAESFDQVISFSTGQPLLTPGMQERGIALYTTVAPTVFYTGFNMLDDVVGGYSEPARKLRRAISIALDYEEFIDIFLNGRGIPAQGPIPPPVFGHLSAREGLNQYVFRWVDGGPERRPIEDARELLAEAGYPNGIDPQTGEPLTLYLDTTGTSPGAAARLAWYRKQLGKINIQLIIRNTTFNRLQQKMASGNIQLFFLGWIADYPDPENFLFLLYGPNAKAKYGGVNTSNYMSPKFDALFRKMRDMPNGRERALVIEHMVEILRRDAPWVWGFYPKNYSLTHAWLQNYQPNLMANNGLK
ncbi:MAG: ABC transporter substrate-binding protein, partial [Salinisphaera sp.]|nr:ABC transporter substrate-binding protein [Salinisphaera sp.]